MNAFEHPILSRVELLSAARSGLFPESLHWVAAISLIPLRETGLHPPQPGFLGPLKQNAALRSHRRVSEQFCYKLWFRPAANEVRLAETTCPSTTASRGVMSDVGGSLVGSHPRTTLKIKTHQTIKLICANVLSKNDSGAPMNQAEFLSRAWQAANDKARELGWIV